MVDAHKKIKLNKPNLSKSFNQEKLEPKIKLLIVDPDQYSTEDGVYFSFNKNNSYAHLIEKDDIASMRGNETHSFIVLQDGRSSYFDCGIDALQDMLEDKEDHTTIDLTEKSVFTPYIGKSLAPKDIIKLCPLRRKEVEKQDLEIFYTGYGEAYYQHRSDFNGTIMDYIRKQDDKQAPYYFLTRNFWLPKEEMADILTATRLLGGVVLDIQERCVACIKYYKENKQEAPTQKGVLEQEEKAKSRLESSRRPRGRVMIF